MIVHYWTEHKAVKFSSKWCKIENQSDWSTENILCHGKNEAISAVSHTIKKLHNQKNMHMTYKQDFYKTK